MVIYLKRFEDFKAILDRVNLVVFYKQNSLANENPMEDNSELFSLDLYVVEGNSVYGFRESQAKDEEEVKQFLMKFDGAVEVNSIE